MARVTVEDCILNIPNRFDLVITAAQRAKQIASGMPLTIDRDNDKDPVVALREIADKTIDYTLVNEEIIGQFQKHINRDPAAVEEENEPTMYSSSPDGDMQTLYGESAAQHFLPESQAPQTPSMSFVEENIEVED
jgi:DNA-directed RNA polymerase subunit omega